MTEPSETPEFYDPDVCYKAGEEPEPVSVRDLRYGETVMHGRDTVKAVQVHADGRVIVQRQRWWGGRWVTEFAKVRADELYPVEDDHA